MSGLSEEEREHVRLTSLFGPWAKQAILALDDAGKERDERLAKLESDLRVSRAVEGLHQVCACCDGVFHVQEMSQDGVEFHCRSCQMTMSEERGLHLLDRNTIEAGVGGVLTKESLEAAGRELLREPDPLPALVLKFTKHYGGLVVCDYHTPKGPSMAHKLDGYLAPCLNPRPAEEVTLEVVLGVLRKPPFWRVEFDFAPELPAGEIGVSILMGSGRRYVCAHIDLMVALLRAWEKAVEAEGDEEVKKGE